MGWANWNAFGCNYNSSIIRRQADLLVSLGLRDVGFDTVIIQECISSQRAPNGTIIPDKAKFPEGLPALVDYLHSHGLKAGTYLDVGTETCAGYIGSYGHYKLDTATYASMGFDFLEFDSCHHNSSMPPYSELYAEVRDAFNATGRPMVFYMCVQGQDDVQVWGPDTGNLWRTTQDICAPGHPSFDNVVKNFLGDTRFPNTSLVGAHPDADMMVVGMDPLTVDQWQTHFSMWVIAASPLWIGVDLNTVQGAALALLLNKDAVAINQDPASKMGERFTSTSAGQVWVKPLTPSAGFKLEFGVMLWNTNSAATTTLSVNFKDMGLPATGVTVLDIWGNTTATYENSFTASDIPADGTVLLRVSA